MKTAYSNPPTDAGRRSAGFSLIELLVVITLIAILAAMVTPSMVAYLRTYKIRAALNNLAGELQAARNQAITRNSTRGVSLYVVDKNSYRIINEDLLRELGRPADSEFGPLRALPNGIEFVRGTDAAVRFQRMGQICVVPGTCGGAAAATLCPATDAANCGDNVGNYVAWDAGQQVARITLVQVAYTRQMRVDITSGGRVEVER